MEEAVAKIMGSIGADSLPEMALVFVSASHEDDFDHLVPLLRKRLPSLKNIFGCSVSVICLTFEKLTGLSCPWPQRHSTEVYSRHLASSNGIAMSCIMRYP